MTNIEKNINIMNKNLFGQHALTLLIRNNLTSVAPYRLNTKNVKEDIERFFLKSIDFGKHSNYIVFGIGNIELLKSIIEQMTELSTLTILENDLHLLKNCLNKFDLSALFKDLRVVLITGSKDEIIDLINLRVSMIEFIVNLNNVHILSNPYMKSGHEHYISEISYFFVSKMKYIMSNIGNDVTDVLAGLKYTLENWKSMALGLGINHFKDSYKDVPAIIVSAGPSLDKNIELLKEVQGKALIFTVDATYNKVMQLGITPDAISSIERYDLTYNAFFENKKVPIETVFIAPPVVTKKVFDLFDNKVTIGRMGELFVMEILNKIDYESVELGISCSHVPFAFANYIGANPIIFIGQDLAFSKEGKTHSENTSEEAIKAANRATKTSVIGNDGTKYETTKAYYQFLTWFENEIAKRPSKSFINATEGGAKIKGTEVITFREAIDKNCFKEVKPLVKTYKFIKQSNPNNTELIKNELTNYIDTLIETISINELKYSNYLDRLMKINDIASKENIKDINTLHRDLFVSLNKDTSLRFIVQSIFITFHRNLNKYSVNLDQNSFVNVKFMIQRHIEVMLSVFTKLSNELKELKNYYGETND